MGKNDDRTEAPSAKRKKEARDKGEVARSPDLVAWLMLLVGTSLMPGLMSGVIGHLHELLGTISTVAAHPDTAAVPDVVGKALMVVLTSLAPTLMVFVGLAVVGNMAQVGLLFTFKPLKPKFSHLNPKNGLKRMFSVKGLWQIGAAAIRLSVIGAVVWSMVGGIARDMATSSMRSVTDAISQLAVVSLGLVRIVAAVCVVIGVGDYLIKRRSMTKQLKMTKPEAKQEAKEAEGDPHVRGRMRTLRLQMSRNRMIGAVAFADVVITNPTHLAIAISYKRERGAPKVVARGADEVAAKIRAEADRHGVPCVEAKPLARTLYRVCRPGEEIPLELYQAVATVLAFLHRLGESHRAYKGRLGLDVPDTWTPSDIGELPRRPPRRARRVPRPHNPAGTADRKVTVVQRQIDQASRDRTRRPGGTGQARPA